MRISTAASFTFLVISMFIAVATARDVFRCPVQTSSNCSCSPSPKVNQFFIQCAESTEKTIVNILPGQKVNVQCAKNMPPFAYQVLPLGNKTYIKSMELKFCPLPETSFGNLMSHMSISNVKDFRFWSYKSLNETLTYHLEGIKDVTKLYLQHNKFTQFPDNIFDNMKSLTWLDLTYNSIQLDTNFLKSLTTVKVLILRHNQILKLPNNILSNMSSLELLDISHNNMEEIMPGAFIGLNQLTQLDLSCNNLRTLHIENFNALPNLFNLRLNDNNFTNYPDGIFVNNKKLKTIKLMNNKTPLSSFPDLFLANLDRMEEVYLNDNKLKRVPENMFSNSTYIKSIYLNNNMLEHIPSNLFSNQRNLEKLDLSSNLIGSLSNEVFVYLVNLKTLNLNHNSIEHLHSKLLYDLITLEQFNINNNKIHTIDDNALCNKQSNLMDIDMSHNLMKMSTRSPLEHCSELRNVNLSHNKITEICEDWKNISYLKKLNLSNNSITKIQYESFVSYPIVEVDLTYNNITTLGLRKHNDKFTDEYVPKMLVKNNPVICDCNLHEFINYFGNKRKSHVWDGVNNLMCADPPDLRGTLIKDVKLDQLLCRVSEFCPENCECYKRYYDKASIVKCSNITLVPAVPKNPKGTNHTELHLEDNQITSFSQLDLDTRNRNVTKLYLQNNRITDLKLTENIEVLNLSYNRLKYVNDIATAALSDFRLRDLYLFNNSLACDCENHDFLLFLQDKNHKIRDFKLLSCSDGRKISTLKLHLLCNLTPWLVVVLVLLALAGMSIGLSAALYYKYKQQIKIFLFSKGWFLSWVSEEEVDKDKSYDAFLSFSHKDEDFVINELVTVLENDPQPHKLCIHFRDWTAGELISTQIRRSVEDSRRTIVVLSPNFLESVWGQLEFKEAYSHALKERRARVIIILYCNIVELNNLDPELQAYLDNNTYVKWGDPWFWEKLRYALPHRTCLEKNISDGYFESKKYEDKKKGLNGAEWSNTQDDFPKNDLLPVLTTDS